MLKENEYAPSSPEIGQLITKSIALTKNKALMNRPNDFAKKMHQCNIHLLIVAQQAMKDAECHARAGRTIVHLQSLIDTMDETVAEVEAEAA